jgi:hypothetical protein
MRFYCCEQHCLNRAYSHWLRGLTNVKSGTQIFAGELLSCILRVQLLPALSQAITICETKLDTFTAGVVALLTILRI